MKILAADALLESCGWQVLEGSSCLLVNSMGMRSQHCPTAGQLAEGLPFTNSSCRALAQHNEELEALVHSLRAQHSHTCMHNSGCWSRLLPRITGAIMGPLTGVQTLQCQIAMAGNTGHTIDSGHGPCMSVMVETYLLGPGMLRLEGSSW